MNGNIFLLQDGSSLVKMREALYDSESLLQELLAKHPDLLAGEQINSDEPRRWLLVTREMRVPGEEDGAGRWSLDHLFLDQDAIPTLVEVKQSSNTDMRRKVVGQMLDYAANAVVYWPIEEIKARFDSRCVAESKDPEAELSTLLAEGQDAANFWQQVKTNLQAGRIRMVFIADEIPPELRRVVEFLNSQMDPAEVLAIEIKQFVGEGMKTLVPRVLGQTETARQKKTPPGSRPVDVTEEEYLREYDAQRPDSDQKVARRLIEWAKAKGLTVNFRRRQRVVSFIPYLQKGDDWYYPMSLRDEGIVVIQFRWLKKHPPFCDESKRRELFDRIKNIPGFNAIGSGLDGYPSFPVSSLTQQKPLDTFIATLDWIVAEIETAHNSP